MFWIVSGNQSQDIISLTVWSAFGLDKAQAGFLLCYSLVQSNALNLWARWVLSMSVWEVRMCRRRLRNYQELEIPP